MARDHNNTLQSYQDAVIAAGQGDAQLKLDAAGQVGVKSRTDKLADFTSPETGHRHNQAVLLDFKAVLSEAYGPQAADTAFQQVDSGTTLNAKITDGRPLTTHRVTNAVDRAATVSAQISAPILAADALHGQLIADRDARAANWQPQVQPSTLPPGSPGLRYNLSDQGGIRTHGWHPRTQEDYRVFELNQAVRAEMAAMQHPPQDARLHNLQARLNLLDRMVGEAHNHLLGGPGQAPAQSARQNVFLAPEWLFSGMERTEEGTGLPMSGGALTEGEMRKVTEALTEMSGRYPGMLIVPGTILWSKPLDPVPTLQGVPRPMDIVLNSAPVVANGRLEHLTYKRKEGMDPAMATWGTLNGTQRGAARAEPNETNNFAARLQVFRGDSQQLPMDLTPALAAFDAATAAGRGIPQWEQALRQGAVSDQPWQDGFAASGQVQQNNHLFLYEDRTFALDVCQDHNPNEAAAKNEALNQGADPLRTRVNTEGGVDAHLVVAAGSTLNKNANYVKDGGAYMVNDFSGVLMCTEMHHDLTAADPRLLRPVNQIATFTFKSPPFQSSLPPVNGDPGLNLGGAENLDPNSDLDQAPEDLQNQPAHSANDLLQVEATKIEDVDDDDTLQIPQLSTKESEAEAEGQGMDSDQEEITNELQEEKKTTDVLDVRSSANIKFKSTTTTSTQDITQDITEGVKASPRPFS